MSLRNYSVDFLIKVSIECFTVAEGGLIDIPWDEIFRLEFWSSEVSKSAMNFVLFRFVW